MAEANDQSAFARPTAPPPPPGRQLPDADAPPAGAWKLEWAAFVVLCLLALWLNGVLYLHRGAFWGDEASSINMAAAPGFGAVWGLLSRDAFPGLFVTLLRFWTLTGSGGTDTGMCLFGTLIGLGIVASACVAVWMLVRRAPLVAMPLVAFNATIFYTGSSVRAYGLAALLMTLCAAAFWRMVQKPTGGNVAASLLLALLGAHASYQNACLLFAVGVAGAVACAACRRWRRSALVLGICMLAALSMTIYLPQIAEYRGTHELICEPSLGWETVAAVFLQALAESSWGLGAVWGMLLLLAGGLLLVAALTNDRDATEQPIPSLSLYCLIAGFTAGLAGLIFFETTRRDPHPWYFLSFVCLAAVIVDVGMAVRPARWTSWARVLAASIIVVVSLPGAWTAAHTRRTNMDIIAETLNRVVRPGDFVLLDPALMAPGFCYHYHGSAPWDTVPSLPHGPDVTIAPVHPLRQAIATPHSIDPTLQRVRQTLASGGRLFLVGDLVTSPDSPPPELPPAPHPLYGWNLTYYCQEWSARLSYLLEHHAVTVRGVSVIPEGPLSGYDCHQLLMIEGWREAPKGAPPP